MKKSIHEIIQPTVPAGLESLSRGIYDKSLVEPLAMTQSLYQQLQIAQKISRQSAFIRRLNALPQVSALDKIFQDEQARRQILKAALTPEFLSTTTATSDFIEAFDTLPSSEQDEVLDEIRVVNLDDESRIISLLKTIPKKIQSRCKELISSLKKIKYALFKDLAGTSGLLYTAVQDNSIISWANFIWQLIGVIGEHLSDSDEDSK